MNDFKAPPPPPGNFAAPEQNVPPAEAPVEEVQPTAPASSQEAPENVGDNQTTDFKGRLQSQKEMLMGKFNQLPSNKKQVLLAAGIFVIGLLLGAIMFGGSCDPVAPAPKGLQGVVSNPDIKTDLKRCGLVEASSPCVLYVMNSYTYEKLAEDFFETAVSVTRRKDLVIRMDNVRYATMRIPPGYFAQIKIPAYK